jgi:hypothetical protein
VTLTRWGDDDWPEDGLCMDCAREIESGLLQCDACERRSLQYFWECDRIETRKARFAEHRQRWGALACVVDPVGAFYWWCQ